MRDSDGLLEHKDGQVGMRN